MTDLPRRSFPLVVPPPGGFEDAVRRGRGLRRRRASGGSAAVLVLVGALGYSMLGTSGVSRLNETRDPAVTSSPAPGVLVTPTPQTSATLAGGSAGGTIASGPRGTVPSVSVTPAGPRSTGRPGTTVRFAARPPVRQDNGMTNASSQCLTSTTSNGWCAYAYVDDSHGADEGTYTFDYYVCRPVDAASDGTLHWKRHLRVDFVAIDVDHDDPVFTYSRAIPVKHEATQQSVPVGTCMHWSITWNGYDDYGLNPPAGKYRLVASSFAEEQPQNATYDFTHQ